MLQRAIFDCCKWHLQTQDRPVLCSFPLVPTVSTWAHLSGLATALARETLAAEEELLQRSELHDRLGLPSALRRCLRGIPKAAPTPGGVRAMRFDFHWTTTGWRISEANTDVAGGWIEASGVTALLAADYPDCQPAGDPAGVLSDAILRVVGPGAMVGLMHLTIFSEDRQIMLYLARRLQERGLTPSLFSPEQLGWDRGQARVQSAWYSGPVALVFRFFPAEWLPRLPARTGWQNFLAGGRSAVCNPAYAVLTQSKRFPLVWDDLSTPLPTWRALLPATWSPRDVAGELEDGWVLKPALGHEGDSVAMPGVSDPADWQQIRRTALKNPDAWAAQQRFETLPLATPEGPTYPCLGIYVIDGRVAGAFGRLAARPLIDAESQEVVVLIPKEPENG